MGSREVGLLLVSAAGMGSLIAGFSLRLGASYLIVLALVGGATLAYGVTKGLRARRERDGAEPSREEIQNAYQAMRYGLAMYPIGFLVIGMVLVYIEGSALSSILILGGWALMAIGGAPTQMRLMREYREKLESAA